MPRNDFKWFVVELDDVEVLQLHYTQDDFATTYTHVGSVYPGKSGLYSYVIFATPQWGGEPFVSGEMPRREAFNLFFQELTRRMWARQSEIREERQKLRAFKQCEAALLT